MSERSSWVKLLSLFLLLFALLACDHSEDQAREAMAVLNSAPEEDEKSLDTAYQNAKGKAVLVSDDGIRSRLVEELDATYQRRKEPFEAARLAAAEEERRQREIEQAQRLAQIELERKRQEVELQLQQQAQAEAAIQALADAAGQAEATKKFEGIRDLKVGTRYSLMDESTQVLILRNLKSYSVDFNLKCYTRRSSSKTFFVSVPALGEKEIGFLEGWEGNFVSGERCDAYYGDHMVWYFEIP
jgi:hypothetical protein